MNSSLMSPKSSVAGLSRRIKRERSSSLLDSPRKRPRTTPSSSSSRIKRQQPSGKRGRETSPEVDELQDAVETILLPSDIAALNHDKGRESVQSSTPSSPTLAAELVLPKSSPPPGKSIPDSSPSAGSHAPMIITEPTEFTVASGSKLQQSLSSPPPPPAPCDEPEPLSSYSCPICFFPPTNATLTPCGHVCCGSCLFTAVKTMIQRGAMMPEAFTARCPVCRAQIPGWDGRGGGIIGLKVRASVAHISCHWKTRIRE
ncbi:hypothetical protein DFH07DRAFT_386728 [Mycena maculata]|uniref:RING-type domain-containing protein n=1 Tax=Mycena maculata TaxID=230809 RepID=A0AAD7KCK3_9AGAR|nr:hypothetical protein DFH07DRAFT_386728 [Mycena maculata]